MKKKSAIGIITLWLVANTTILLAQNVTRLTVLDTNDKSPMIGAHVCLLDGEGNKSYYVTDIDGNVTIPFTENQDCSISYAGYKTLEFKPNSGNQTIKLAPDLLMLDQVIMTASVETVKMDQSIYNIEVINAKTLESQGAQNARDALRFQPNINLREDGVLGSQIIMQGLSGQHVKVLIDGVPIIGRQNGNIDLSQIDMTQVDHIEIIEGPMSVVYGSNALAGTINIITKDHKYYDLNASAGTYVESIGQFNGNGSVSGSIGNHRYSFGGGYRLFDGHDLDKSDRSMNWNPKEQFNIDTYYGYKTDTWDSKIGVRHNHELLTIRTDTVSWARAFNNEYITDRTTFYAQAKKSFSESYTLSGMLSYSVYDRSSLSRYVNLSTGSQTPVDGSDSRDLFTGWNNRLSMAKSFENKTVWQLGYELTQEDGKGEKITDNEGLMENSLWSDVQIFLGKNWIIQPGFRYVHHNIFNAPLIYSSHLKWTDRSWQGRLSFARGFRAPSMKELYMDFVDSNHQIFGNEDLVPETSYNLTAVLSKSIEWSQAGVIKTEVTGFYNHLDDVIELVQGTDGQSYYYQNVAQKKTHGGTLSVLYNWKNRLKYSAGFTLTGNGFDPVETNHFDYRYAKDLVANVTYYSPKIDFSAQFDYKYTGKRVQLFASDADDEWEEGTVGAYSMLNYSMTKNFKNKRYSLTGGVKNILDVTNVSNTTRGGAHSGTGGLMIAWGRTYFLSFKVNLKKL